MEKAFINIVIRQLVVIYYLVGTTKMWLMLVTTIATVAWSDAEYLYNAPKVPFNLPSNVPTNNYALNSYQRYDYNNKEGAKSEYNSFGNSGEYTNQQSSQNFLTGNLNSANGGYTNSFTPFTNNNINNQVQTNQQQQWQPITSNINTGYTQSSLLPTNYNPNLPVMASYSNSYVLPQLNINPNSGYSNTVSGSNNYYNDYSYIPPALPQNNYRQSFVPTGGSTTATGSYNNAYSEGLKPPVLQNNGYSQSVQSNLNSNSGYNQGATSNANINFDIGKPQSFSPATTFRPPNGYTQSTSSTINNQFNSGYANSFASAKPFTPNNGNTHSALLSTNNQLSSGYANSVKPTPSFNPSKGFTQSTSSINSNQLNSGYGNSVTLLPPFNSNTGYTQSISSSIINNLNTDYTQGLIPPKYTNNVYGQSFPATDTSSTSSVSQQSPIVSSNVNGHELNTNGGINNGYLPPVNGNGPTHIDLSSDLTQFSSAASSIFNNVDKGFVQTTFNEAASTGSLNFISNKPNVIPLVHKHIYFHVPPPDIEENRNGNALSQVPKKNYKILFIKTPSQESKSIRNGPIEDKTLIYVLVKKSDDPKPIVLPKSKPSKHEVFFVKYNDSPFDIAARVNAEIDKTGSINSLETLLPGLANGRQR